MMHFRVRWAIIKTILLATYLMEARMVGSSALIDAAIVFGAERILSGAHDDPAWPYRKAFKREDDERLFRELLHQLTLYDALFLDSSSLSEGVPNEVLSLCRRINGDVNIYDGTGVIRVFIANMDASPDNVKRSFCQYIGARVHADDRLAARLSALRIPWAYHQLDHYDCGSMQLHVKAAQLDELYLPFALFAWRGFMYGAIAHSERRSGNDLGSYVAAPGRISALREILVADDMEHFNFPNEAWRSLTYDLPSLPERGYDFSFVRSLPAVDTSPIATLAWEQEPQDALARILDWRTTRGGRDLRLDWEELLHARYSSTIVGSTNIQIAKNINVGGDFKQTIVARAR